MLSNSLCPAGVVNVEGTPRTVAGDAITTDANKCQLKPLNRSDYPGITFTGAQWATLQETFPAGVCDFSKPGVDQQPTDPVADLPEREGTGDLRRQADGEPADVQGVPGAQQPPRAPVANDAGLAACDPSDRLGLGLEVLAEHD